MKKTETLLLSSVYAKTDLVEKSELRQTASAMNPRLCQHASPNREPANIIYDDKSSSTISEEQPTPNQKEHAGFVDTMSVSVRK